jgi:hypothetical protein
VREIKAKKKKISFELMLFHRHHSMAVCRHLHLIKNSNFLPTKQATKRKGEREGKMLINTFLKWPQFISHREYCIKRNKTQTMSEWKCPVFSSIFHFFSVFYCEMLQSLHI